jgi:predicted RNase H-like nuclease (RuvC/YqgF family)
MSNNVVSTAADELKKWLEVLQQIIKEKQAYDAKQAAKIDKAEMRQLQETRHEQMMAKFDKLANNGGDVNELKKAIDEAQKEVQNLRKQLDGPEAKIEGDKPKLEIGSQRKKTGTDAGLTKDDAGKWKRAIPANKVDAPKLNVPKLK